MANNSIYRGYDVEERDGAVWVSRGGASNHFSSVAAAYNWIDEQRRQQNKNDKTA